MKFLEALHPLLNRINHLTGQSINNGLKAVFMRELSSYFHSAVAFIFVLLFVFLTGVFTFYVGFFLERNESDLIPFFAFHPYLYLFFIPALSMRLWAEEKKTGTIELLLSLPISLPVLMISKFLAAWAFTAVSLLFTFPLWITVTILGNPDHGMIIAGYVGSLFLAGGFLAIGCCLSVITNSQVIAFILSAVVCFLFLMMGFPLVVDMSRLVLPEFMVQIITGLSALTYYEGFMKGILDLRSIFYFLSLIATWLAAGIVCLDRYRGKN